MSNLTKQLEEQHYLGKAIQSLRAENKMSIHELANQTGISVSYLAHLESGVRKNPSYTVLQLLAVGLGVSLSQLINVLSEQNQE
ncbi:helix-turn-helix domain-containing protein [Paenibacillus sp. FSL L8-0499]|uniref:helix-turn-helix domain-containing protein n=1 Tax=Paenibacillus sp. FSL L8-0499 TaxID=2975334 RepID=UPI0030F55CA8